MTMASWARSDQSAPGRVSVSPKPSRSGAMQRNELARRLLTLRQTNDENGHPWRSRIGGPLPSSW